MVSTNFHGKTQPKNMMTYLEQRFSTCGLQISDGFYFMHLFYDSQTIIPSSGLSQQPNFLGILADEMRSLLDSADLFQGMEYAPR